MNVNLDNKDFMEEIDRNVVILHRTIETQKYLVALLRGKGGDDEKKMFHPALHGATAREEKLRKTLCMAVETIEETRRSFKSRKLEGLRKELLRVLLESSDSPG